MGSGCSFPLSLALHHPHVLLFWNKSLQETLFVQDGCINIWKILLAVRLMQQYEHRKQN